MTEEYSADMITLIDDEGDQHEFQVLDAIQTDDGKFVALFPTSEEDGDEGTYYIFEVIEENGEEQLVEVEDDDVLDSLAEIFAERFDEIYGECDCDCEDGCDCCGHED